MNDNGYIEISTDIQQLITSEQAWHYFIIPKSAQNGMIELYISEDKFLNGVVDELEMLFGKQVKVTSTDPDVIHKSLGRYYRRGNNRKENNQISIKGEYSQDFLISLINEANSVGSSDIPRQLK